MLGPVPAQISGFGLHFKTSIKPSMGAAICEGRETHLSVPIFLISIKEKEKLISKRCKISENYFRAPCREVPFLIAGRKYGPIAL